jgi:hypothetical protein
MNKFYRREKMKQKILGFFIIVMALVFMGCNPTTDTPAGPIAVAFSGLSANGTSGSVSTTLLTLTFDVDPTTLAASDITVTGATQGALTGSPGLTRTLAISAITVADGANVTVALADPAGFAITPASKTVAVNVAPTFPTTGMNASLVLGQADYVTNTTGITSTTLNSPQGILYTDSKLIVADRNNHRVLIWNSLPTTNWKAADVVVGQADFTSNTSGTTTATSLWGPQQVSSDGTKLFVADRNNNRVLIYNTIPTSTGAAANVVVGQTSLTTFSTGTTQSTLNYCFGVCVSGTKMLIGDRTNNRVLIYNTIPSTNGANADYVIGQSNFTTGTSGLTSSNMDTPNYVWTNGTKVIVADTNNHRVLVWNTFPSSNGQAADVVIGQSDFISNSSGITASTLANPSAIAVDSSGRLCIADSMNCRILIYNSIPTTNGVSADYVIGQSSFTTQVSAITQSGLNYPMGINFDSNGNFWVTDRSNNRVLKY